MSFLSYFKGFQGVGDVLKKCSRALPRATLAFLNLLADGFGLGGSDVHFKQVAAMVAQQGYTPLVRMVNQAVLASGNEK